MKNRRKTKNDSEKRKTIKKTVNQGGNIPKYIQKNS